MTPHELLAALGLYAGAFAVGAISSVIPIVAIDVFVVAVADSAGVSITVALLAAAGQLVGKLPVFYATRKLSELPGPHRARLDRIRARWRRAPGLVLATSAVLGLPPFSLMATAAGALAIRPRQFCALVFTGRAVRFLAIAAITAIATR